MAPGALVANARAPDTLVLDRAEVVRQVKLLGAERCGQARGDQYVRCAAGRGISGIPVRASCTI